MKKLIFFTIILFSFCSKAQQLPHYSLYMFNDGVINPSITGTKSHDYIVLSSRSQWVGIDGAPRTQLLSYFNNLSDNMGSGITLFNDETGPIRTTGTQISFGTNFRLSNDIKLSFGLSSNIFQYVFDGTMTQLYDSQFDFAAIGSIEKQILADASFGTYLYNENFHLGFSTLQLVQYNFNSNYDDFLVRHYFISSGYNISVNESYDLIPSVLFKSTNATPFQYDINLRLSFEEQVWGGISFRNEDAFVFMFGGVIENILIGYSYDRTISDLNTISDGTHSIMLGLKFNEINLFY